MAFEFSPRNLLDVRLTLITRVTSFRRALAQGADVLGCRTGATTQHRWPETFNGEALYMSVSGSFEILPLGEYCSQVRPSSSFSASQHAVEMYNSLGC